MVDNDVAPQPPGGAPKPALVDIIDPVADRVVASVAVAPNPHHIYAVPGTNEAYVTHLTGCALDVVNLVDHQVIGQIGTRFGPRHLSFSSDGRLAYIVDYYDQAVTVIDTASNSTVGEIPTGPYPNYTETTAVGNRVFVVNSGANTVTVARAHAPFTVIKTVTVGSKPFDLALARDGRTLVVTNAGDDTVSFLDAQTLSVMATVSIGPKFGPPPPGVTQKMNVRIALDGRTAWVGDQAGSRVAVLDVATRRLVADLPASGGADIFAQPPDGPARGIGLVTARYGTFIDTVGVDPPRVLDQAFSVPECRTGGCATDYPGRTGPPGTGPHLMVFDPSGQRAYATDRPGSTVSVFDLTSGAPTFLTNIPTSYAPYGFPDGIAYISFSGGVAHAS
ncbi:MAG: hypothetical protein NVS3B12_09460 [Acidimicrobiales bacterium]